MKKQKNLKRKNNEEKGITLIALVITIIVLLILAGVTIATLTGENGILTKASDAKRENEIASVKEQAKLDISNYIAEKIKNGEDTTINTPEKVQEILEAENQNNENKYYKGFTDTGITTPSGYEVAYEELYTIGNLQDETTLAGDVLKVNPNAEEDKDKSTYVRYNGINCRVLYNDDIHGLQIITIDTLGNSVVIGYDDDYDEEIVDSDDDFQKAIKSYNNLLDNLSKRAKSYMDKKGIAIDARCVGSIATLENNKFQGDTSEMWTGNLSLASGKIKTSDENYLEDVNQIEKLNLKTYSSLLASRGLEQPTNKSSINFFVRTIDWTGTIVTKDIIRVFSFGPGVGLNEKASFRSIFLIPFNTPIIEGDGSSENPYIL